MGASRSNAGEGRWMGGVPLVGDSEPIKNLYRQIRQGAGTDIPVLLVGPSGTGKDLVAASIHERSTRSEEPFITVNLGALSHQLVPAELFGYEKGAFTGAIKRRRGKFEQAAGGTIFLDEISSISDKVQVGLLRLIEKKRFHRIGSREEVEADVRIIAASNQDLLAAVENGSFREDLFYRLDVFRISVPPLNERRGDIALLTEEFLKRYNMMYGREVSGVSPECMGILERYDWPGNIRELKNVIQRAVLVSEGSILQPQHLPERFVRRRRVLPEVSFELGTPLEDIEKDLIIRTLRFVHDNRSKTARMLGISRRALYNKLEKYRIQ